MSSIESGETAAGMRPGDRIGPYEVEERLGAGGMGVVLRARDPRLGRAVAIKVLPPEVAQDPQRLRRFDLQARTTGNLQASRQVVRDGYPTATATLLSTGWFSERRRPMSRSAAAPTAETAGRS
jgi:serine/threonine protein kinase